MMCALWLLAGGGWSNTGVISTIYEENVCDEIPFVTTYSLW